MDFARKQLEKYGWTDGKGLGKNENGISEAIKPKLKRSVAGIGHDPATEFTEHWWSQLYDKAAKNVEVKEKDGKTKKIKTKDENFKITNSTYHLTKSDSKSDEKEEYSDFFVKTVVLTNGGTQERVRESESEPESENDNKTDVFKMTDEELFAACEGRTAHKGARHGLKATGKLARIQRQEQELLALPKYTGYSHSKKSKKHQENSSDDIDSEVVENAVLDTSENKIKKKKKKRKRCFSEGNMEEKLLNVEPEETLLPEEKDVDMAESVSTSEVHVDKVKSRKKKKVNNEEQIMETKETASGSDEIIEKSTHKNKKHKKKKKEHEES